MNELITTKNAWLKGAQKMKFLLAMLLFGVISQTSHAGMTIQFYGEILGNEPIPGNPIINLYDSDQFPDEAVAIEGVTTIQGLFGDFIDSSSGFFEWPQPFAAANSGIDNYGAVAQGVFYAPVSGDYRFFIRSDDQSELFITEGPMDLETLKDDPRPTADAKESDCCDGFEEGEAATSVFSLEAGDIRYITFAWKEGGGGDWMQLGISIDGSTPETMPLGHVQRYIYDDDFAPKDEELRMAAIDQDGAQSEFDVIVLESTNVSFFVEFDVDIDSADEAPEVTWFLNNDEIEGQKGTMLTMRALTENEGDVIKAVIEGVGESEMTLGIDPDIDSPVITGVDATGNPAGVLVTFSEPVTQESAEDTSNYEIDGQTIISATLVADNQVHLNIGEYDDSPMEISISGVVDLAADANEVEPFTGQVALTPGLFLYLPLDDDAIDIINGKEPVTEEGIQYTNDGDRGDVAEFEGDDAHINLGEITQLFGRVPQFSISAWFKRSADNSGDNTNHNVSNVIVAHSSSSGNDNFEIGSAGANIEGYLDTIGRDANLPVISAGLGNDQWHHLLWVFDGPSQNEVKIYVDGELVFENDLYGNVLDDSNNSNRTNWSIGMARPLGSQRWGDFTGRMDDIAFWDTALTASMAAGLADGSVNPLTVGSVATGPLTLNTDLEDVTVDEKANVTLTADVTGSETSVLQLEWYRDGVLIPGETSNTLTLNDVSPGDNGAKFNFIAYNANGTFNRVESGEITLTVNADVEAPLVTEAGGVAFGVNKVRVSFDEPVDPATAEDTSNYTFEEGVTVESATLKADGVTVDLETSELERGVTYNLTVQGVKDISAAGNESDSEAAFEAVANYEAIVLADNPVRYWRFNDAEESTTVADIAVEGENGPAARIGTVVDGVEFEASSLIFSDPENGAISLRENARINVPIASDLNSVNGPWAQKTFEAWIRPDSFPPLGATANTAAMGIYEQGGNDRALGAFIWRLPEDEDESKAHLVFFAFNRLTDGGGVGSPWFEPANGSEGIYTSIEIDAGSTYHVVGVMDGTADIDGTITLYVNGENVSEIGGVGLLYNHTGDVRIGHGDMKLPDNSTGAWIPFDGVIDEMALYNAALTEDQVQRHFDMAFDGNESGPAQIVTNPASASAPERGFAEFIAEFAGSQPITATWTINGEFVAGSIDGTTTMTTFLTDISMDGATIEVTVTNAEGEATSQAATLTVVPETTAPEIVSVSATGGDLNSFVIEFNEDMDEASALNAANYKIEGLTINSLSIDDTKTIVTLTTSEQENGTTYNLEITGVKDGSSTGNAYAGGPIEAESSFDYTLAVLSDDPVGYFKLGDTENATAVNQVVANWNGTYVAVNAPEIPEQGVERLVVGSSDGAAKFSNNRINIPDNTRLNTGGPYREKSLEIWFKAEELPRAFDEGTLPDKDLIFEQGGATRGISIYLSGTQNQENPDRADLYFHIWNRGANDGVGSPWGFETGEARPSVFVNAEVEAGKTYHAVMTVLASEEENEDFNGFLGSLIGYLNGEEVGNVEGPGLLYNHGDNAGIGMVRQNVVYHDQSLTTDNSYPFIGVIDEFALYNHVLSPERVQFHYEIGNTPVEIDQPGEVEFTSLSTDGVNISMEWSAGTLQSAPTVDGPWTDVADATSPYSEAVAEGAKFFRLVP